MQQLTGLDAAFLALETANSTGHVGGVSVLDPSGAPAPLTLARLTEVVGARLPLVPVLRRKLLSVPLGLDQPYWVDDPNFDIEYHVREIALPRPGSDAQLTEQAPGSGVHQDSPLGHRRCLRRGAADDPA
jgi:diacylglycerol O-acyltransferase / wax synthase